MIDAINIPIYGGVIYLSVSDDPLVERRKHDDKFGMCLVTSCNALASSSDCGGQFALFFKKDFFTHGIIAHEIFHLTHRILDARSLNFTMSHQESHAYLCEWITDWVYKTLKANNIYAH